MKKLLEIVVLSFLVCNFSFAAEKCLKGNCKNGYGMLEYLDVQGNKKTYEGNFVNGRFNGEGTIIDLKIDIYWEGEFKNDSYVKPKVLANYASAKTSGNVIKIPLSIHILKVSEQDFTTVVDKQYVKNEVVIANKIWKQANIVWDLKEVNYVKPNLKNFNKNRQWIQNNCAGDPYACIGDKVKTPKLTSTYTKLLKAKSTRNKKTINVYYIPKMLSIKKYGDVWEAGRCAIYFPSYKAWMRESDKYKNQGYIIVGGRTRLECSTGHRLAHELGHALGLKHVTKGKYLMNGKGSQGHELESFEVNSSRSYFEKYYKILN